ncbi:MAG TPA: XcyI family restriction endonuclease, partial [Chloroflexota bacterium]|nr:XcyI family restriction endonuclease [Chloroflexota bacterium]
LAVHDVGVARVDPELARLVPAETLNQVATLGLPDQPFELVAASDPDVRVSTGTGKTGIPIVAIEIKGGGDSSNALNRAGEAEKSQIKARQAGYEHRWLVMVLGNVPRAALQDETPSTTRIFDANQVMTRSGQDWRAFRDNLGTLLGVTFPDTPS